MVPLRDERGCSGSTVSTADAQRPLSRQISRCAAHAFFAENLRNAKPSSARSVVCTMLMWMWRMRVKKNIAAPGADAGDAAQGKAPFAGLGGDRYGSSAVRTRSLIEAWCLQIQLCQTHVMP